MKQLQIAGLLALAAIVVSAQAPEPRVEFEVATVRKSPPPGSDNAVTAGVKIDGAQARVGMLTLRDYLAMAYRLRTYQIVGPDWISTERFDVSAKLPAGAKGDKFTAMMQSLLEDRFGLKVHREPKEMAIYALTIGKPPLKLKESAV